MNLWQKLRGMYRQYKLLVRGVITHEAYKENLRLLSMGLDPEEIYEIRTDTKHPKKPLS